MQTTPHKTTLEQWRVLQAVVDYGGFVPAAEALHRSHSTLSHAVNKLQEQLGVRLLTIRGRKAQLTPEGELLLRQSRALTRVARSLEHMANRLDDTVEPDLSLLVDHAYPTEWLAAMLAGLDEQCASAIRWRAAPPAECIAAAEDGSADLVIAELGGGQTCARVQLMPVVLAGLADQMGDGQASHEREIVWRGTVDSNAARWHVASPDAALALVRQGAGWTCLPSHMIERHLDSEELATLGEDYCCTDLELSLFSPTKASDSEVGQALQEMLLDSGQFD